jgi:hypothetical protein
MSHWAQINQNNIVTNVTTGPENEPEEVTHQWLVDNLGGTWIQTSYNTRGGIHYGQDSKPDGGVALRKNYAGIGFTYDPNRDAFIGPKPGDTFVLNEETCIWEDTAPVEEE